jgi:hypothetical protein
MISLSCTSCKKLLEMDDAFAGGVCRCQHCGTIQTVPSKLKDRNGSTARAASRTIYAKAARGEAIPSSGLDQLAQVVASSGLTSERLLRAPTIAPPSKPSRQRLLLFVGAAAMLLLAILIGGWFALRNDKPPAQPGPSTPGQTTLVPTDAGRAPAHSQAPRVPNFCDIPLTEHTIVYVLDRGQGTQDLFSYLKEATYRSVESLGSDRKYQIVFWNNGSDDAFPAVPTFAMPQSIDAARRTLDGIFAQGQTDVGPALTQAVKSNPDVVVLATGKGWQLDQTFIDQVLNIRGDRAFKIHTLTLGGEVQSEALKTIAQKSGGTSRLVTEGELKKFARGGE